MVFCVLGPTCLLSPGLRPLSVGRGDRDTATPARTGQKHEGLANKYDMVSCDGDTH